MPKFIRDKILAKVEDEFRRLAAVIKDQNNPLKSVQVITNHPESKAYFEGVLQKYGIQGEVILK